MSEALLDLALCCQTPCLMLELFRMKMVPSSKVPFFLQCLGLRCAPPVEVSIAMNRLIILIASRKRTSWGAAVCQSPGAVLWFIGMLTHGPESVSFEESELANQGPLVLGVHETIACLASSKLFACRVTLIPCSAGLRPR